METISIGAIKAANEKAGGFFFSPATMRFFSSRLPTKGYLSQQGTKAFFVTSERSGWDRPRMFTVRYINLTNGHVDTVGDYHSYENSAEATKVAKRLAQEEV